MGWKRICEKAGKTGQWSQGNNSLPTFQAKLIYRKREMAFEDWLLTIKTNSNKRKLESYASLKQYHTYKWFSLKIVVKRNHMIRSLKLRKIIIGLFLVDWSMNCKRKRMSDHVFVELSHYLISGKHQPTKFNE